MSDRVAYTSKHTQVQFPAFLFPSVKSCVLSMLYQTWNYQSWQRGLKAQPQNGSALLLCFISIYWSCFESVGMSEDLPGTSVQWGPNGWVVKLFRFLLFMGKAGKAVGLENAFFSQFWLTRGGLEWIRGYFSSFSPFGFVRCEQYGAFNSSWEPDRNSFANQPFKDSLKTVGKTNKQKNIYVSKGAH